MFTKVTLLALALSKVALSEEVSTVTDPPTEDVTSWLVFRPNLNEQEDTRIRHESAPDIVYDFESASLDPQRPTRPPETEGEGHTQNLVEQDDPSAPTMGDGDDETTTESKSMQNREVVAGEKWSSTPDLDDLLERDIRKRIKEARTRARQDERRAAKKAKKKEERAQIRWETKQQKREERKTMKNQAREKKAARGSE